MCQKGFVSRIVPTESTTYTFTYDAFGNTTESKAGDNTLATYEYGENNGKLEKITYSNGFSVEYFYNSIEKVAEVWYTNDEGERTLAYEYEYDVYGNLNKFVDNLSGITSVYIHRPDGNRVDFYEYDNYHLYYNFIVTHEYSDYSNSSISGASIDYLQLLPSKNDRINCCVGCVLV